jgi:hypothetical protein
MAILSGRARRSATYVAWCAALNAAQISETLIAQGLLAKQTA